MGCALLSVNAAVLCKNHCERVTQFWTSPSKEEEKEEEGKRRKITFWPSGDFLVLYYFNAFSCHENTQRWMVHL